MVDLLRCGEIIWRIEKMTQSGPVNFGNWEAARKLQLANEAQLAVYQELVEMFEEGYFCEVSDNLTPASNQIDLAALPKPLYRRLAFQKQVGGEWRKIDVLTIGDAAISGHRFAEVWYQTGMILRCDSMANLSGTYRVVYNYRIPDMVNVGDAATGTGGDECQIPREYVEMVPLYGAKQAFLQARQNDAYATLEGDWQRRRADMKRTAQNRAADRRRRVKDVLGYRRGRDYSAYNNQV